MSETSRDAVAAEARRGAAAGARASGPDAAADGSPARRHALHRFPVRIYYADTDAGGVVYHATYLVLAERARIEAMRAAGHPHAALVAEHDCLFMVRRIELEYLRPARLDDMLTITTKFLDETAATVLARQTFEHADGSLCARLSVDLVCVRASSGKPARIPIRWRRAITPAAP